MSNVLIHEINTQLVGTWEECCLTDCTLMFKRHPVGHKLYSLGDRLGVCPLCHFDKKMENGTVPKADIDIDGFVHHKSNDSKPMSDSL